MITEKHYGTYFAYLVTLRDFKFAQNNHINATNEINKLFVNLSDDEIKEIQAMSENELKSKINFLKTRLLNYE